VKKDNHDNFVFYIPVI